MAKVTQGLYERVLNYMATRNEPVQHRNIRAALHMDENLSEMAQISAALMGMRKLGLLEKEERTLPYPRTVLNAGHIINIDTITYWKVTPAGLAKARTEFTDATEDLPLEGDLKKCH